MSKLSWRSIKARELFGKFVRDRRTSLKVSPVALSKALGVTYQTYWHWEVGKSFPNSITKLQTLDLALEGGINEFLRELLVHPSICLSEQEIDELRDFLVNAKYRGEGGSVIPIYNHNRDNRTVERNIRFGKWIHELRIGKNLSLSEFSNLCGAGCNNVSANWERGLSFPRDIDCLQKIDIVSDSSLVPVLFGSCKRYPILLSREERNKIRQILDEKS